MRRLGLLELRQQYSDLAQCAYRFLAHAQRHPLGRAKQIAKHRDAVAFRVLEQQRRAPGAQCAVADLGHFEMGIDLGTDAPELSTGLKLVKKIAQITVFHSVILQYSAGTLPAA